MDIVDDFLLPDEFKALTDVVLGEKFPWFYVNSVSTDNDGDFRSFFFIHALYDEHKPMSEFGFIIAPVLDKLKPKSLLRIKFNMYPKTDEIFEHPFHFDYDFTHNTILLYLNSNDGYTGFDTGEKVESVANRMVHFDATKLHTSTTCTDNQNRVVLVVNYI